MLTPFQIHLVYGGKGVFLLWYVRRPQSYWGESCKQIMNL